MSIDEALDEYQLPFAEDQNRSLRLLAPAGSGKTHSLLWRCMYQWETSKDHNPRFLIFTFTRGAKDELLDRLNNNSDFSQLRSSVEVTTLNSWGFRRLKNKTHNLKLIKNSQDVYFAVHNNLQPVWSQHEKLNSLMTQTRTRSKTAKAIMAIIDDLKSLGFRHDIHFTAKDFSEHAKWVSKAGLELYLRGVLKRLSDLQVIDIYSRSMLSDLETQFLTFWKDAIIALHSMSIFTLEDQKYWTWIELQEAAREGRFTTGMHRVDHIIVDEFQDVNCLDLKLLQAIADANKGNLTIVGDDDQAIYEWRGASPEFILHPLDFIGSNYNTHILSRNYRSPRNIVKHSQELIRNNRRRVDKRVEASSDVDADIKVLTMPSVSETIDYVVNQVKNILEDKSIRNVALIGRKRGQIIPYQIVFASHDIAFYAAEDLQVFLSDAFGELKDMLGINKGAGERGRYSGYRPRK